jgi:SAM-dependent methyltransferase
VGCGDKPYRKWVGSPREYIGIDVQPGRHVDRVIEEGKPWPLDSARFDAVLCTQVLEHVADPQATLSEISRVMKPGGILILSVPFAYNEHGAPSDYRRFSASGICLALADAFEVQEVVRQGGIGTTLSTLFLNWVDRSLGQHRALRALRLPLLPFWIAMSLAVNLVGRSWDAVDRTGAFYGNLLVKAKKR